MTKFRHLALMLLLALPALAVPAQSQTQPFPVTLEKQLAERATNYTEVTLDRKMLDFASKFMDKDNDAEGKRIISKLNGIYVRTYEFDKEGQYTAADLDNIRRQFQGSEWVAMVKQRSKNSRDDSDIYMKMVNGEVQGMFVLNAEAKELNFVFISGPIRPEDLSDIGGNFGIPKGNYAKSEKKSDKDAAKAGKSGKSESGDDE
jgi:hypothetical protein